MPIVDGNYVSPTWVNGQAPAINAQELNALCGTVQQNQSDIQTLNNTVYITRTASGNPATFSDGANNLPIISLVATISPSQSGSGAPSPTNVRPISGTNPIVFFVNDDEPLSVSLGRTVYGGTVDVVNGVLTVDRVTVNLWEDLTWEAIGGNKFRAILPNGEIWGYLGQIVLCSCYGTRASNPASMNDYEYSCGSIYYHDSACWLVIKDSRYSSASDFKTAMNGQQLCYELATPVTYQIAQIEANTALGANTIRTGSAFPVTVTYKGDPSLVVQALEQRITKTQSIIAGVESSTTASKNYSIGNLLIQGDNLYKVTSAIANGAEIIVGTNVAATTVAEQLLLLA